MRVHDDGSEESPHGRVRHDLRGALNALHLGLRVLDGCDASAEALEFSDHVRNSAEKVERLLRDLYAPVEVEPAMMLAGA